IRARLGRKRRHDAILRLRGPSVNRDEELCRLKQLLKTSVNLPPLPSVLAVETRRTSAKRRPTSWKKHSSTYLPRPGCFSSGRLFICTTYPYAAAKTRKKKFS